MVICIDERESVINLGIVYADFDCTIDNSRDQLS